MDYFLPGRGISSWYKNNGRDQGHIGGLYTFDVTGYVFSMCKLKAYPYKLSSMSHLNYITKCLIRYTLQCTIIATAKGRGYVTRHLAKFIIVKASACTVVADYN